MYKVSINQIIQPKTRLISHAQNPYTWHYFLVLRFRHLTGLLELRGPAQRKVSTYTSHTGNPRADINAASGIRTRGPSLRAVKDITRLRPCGHCNHLCCVVLRVNKCHDPDHFHFARHNHNLSFCDMVSVVDTASLYRVVHSGEARS
jgi:hypothetical protein